MLHSFRVFSNGLLIFRADIVTVTKLQLNGEYTSEILFTAMNVNLTFCPKLGCRHISYHMQDLI